MIRFALALPAVAALATMSEPEPSPYAPTLATAPLPRIERPEPALYLPAGYLAAGAVSLAERRRDSGIGEITFPIEGGGWINSQVWGVGGFHGRRGWQCAQENYAPPHQDSFCEPRTKTRRHLNPWCKGGYGHRGVDIRPPTCHTNRHWAVAPEAGRVTRRTWQSVWVLGDSGVSWRYLHVGRAIVKRGERVAPGQRLALVSDRWTRGPTTIHLHLEAWRGGVVLNPYKALVAAHRRLSAPARTRVAEAE
ncbi:MAG: M23 family metallopeptidase [Pseudomonadota bacterium]